MLNPSLECLYILPAFNPNYFGKDSIKTDKLGLPEPNIEQQNNAEQLLYYFDKSDASSSGLLFYPVPDYIAAIDAIGTEIEIGVSNKSLIDNGFGGKTIVNLPYSPATQEEREFEDIQLKQAFAGADKNGGIITMFNNGEQLATSIVQLQPLSSETYLELDKNVKQSIITSHKIPAILLEYNYGGGFNNRAQEMVVAYAQFQTTVIKSYQQTILSVLNRLIKHLGFTDKLEIIPFTLTPIADLTNDTVSNTSKIDSTSTSQQNDTNVSTQQESSLQTN
jgi:hypothetical protein